MPSTAFAVASGSFDGTRKAIDTIMDQLGQGHGVGGDHRQSSGNRLQRGKALHLTDGSNGKKVHRSIESRHILLGHEAEKVDAVLQT